MLALNYNTTSGLLVKGIQSGTEFFLPPFYCGVPSDLSVQALLPTGNPATPFTQQTITSGVITLSLVTATGYTTIVTAALTISGNTGTATLNIPATGALPAGTLVGNCRLVADLVIGSDTPHIESGCILRVPAFALPDGITYENFVGPAGPGVPAGGTTGQALEKIDGTDYHTQWVTPSASTGATLTLSSGDAPGTLQIPGNSTIIGLIGNDGHVLNFGDGGTLGTCAYLSTNASTTEFLRGDGTWATAGSTYEEGTGITISGNTISVTTPYNPAAVAITGGTVTAAEVIVVGPSSGAFNETIRITDNSTFTLGFSGSSSEVRMITNLGLLGVMLGNSGTDAFSFSTNGLTVANVTSGGSVTGASRIYAKAVAGSSEMFVLDEFGNETQISGPFPRVAGFVGSAVISLGIYTVPAASQISVPVSITGLVVGDNVNCSFDAQQNGWETGGLGPIFNGVVITGAGSGEAIFVNPDPVNPYALIGNIYFQVTR